MRDVRDLCSLYGVPEGPQREHLLNLAQKCKQQGWWQSNNLHAFETYIGLENGAVSLKNYQGAIVPGLLQTEEYARAMYQADTFEFNRERVGELIEVRLIRQRILTRTDPPYFWSIIDEAALCRSVGGPEVMRGQLEHVVEVSGLPNITLQIIPFTAGAHLAMDSNFVILEFGEPVPSMVYSEGLAGWMYIERPSGIQRYQRVFETLRTAALNEEDSVRFIIRMIEDMDKST